MATTETVGQGAAGRAGTPPTRRIRVQIRRINPWSVLKVSLVFFLCLFIVVMLGLAILLMILDSIGVLDPIESLIGDFGFGQTVGVREQSQAVFEIDIGWLLRTMFLIGSISTVLWAAFTMFLALLYNLIADLLGGIEVTLVERR